MVNWNEFEKLAGSPQHNFEVLCRALIRLHYGSHGQFAALANQPGVEFHLHLDSKCALGAKGRWLGWQCRWYDLPSGRALGTTRRKKIKEALAKTIKVLPKLTDWILWTRHPLTKSDQKWFYALKAKAEMRLALWTSADAETLLSGDAEILRRTYFGELLLTPNALATQHELSVASVKKRWLSEAHQAIDAERNLRRMLGEADSWDELVEVSNRLKKATVTLSKETKKTLKSLEVPTRAYCVETDAVMRLLENVHMLLRKGDFEFLRKQLDSRPSNVSSEIAILPRLLRSARLFCGLIATNALADMRLGIQLLNELEDCLGKRLVGVLADAGGGKTQLAAQLTAPTSQRPAGLLLHGRDFHTGKTLDDLAKGVTIQGIPVPSFEALVAALDAAGQRSKRRLPIVIDGLNEAEDTRQWKVPLAGLDTILHRFANVLVVCTLRTGARRPAQERFAPEEPEEPTPRTAFAEQALPDSTERIEMPGFGGDTSQAIEKYFRFFRISPGEADLPFEMLSHPLTLRIFCEVTNPERKQEVGIEAMPGSLTGLFALYVDRAIERISELAPNSHRYYAQDVRRVLDDIGTTLWDKKERELVEQEFRTTIGDASRPWNQSIIQMLEQEGLILRIPGESPGRPNFIPVYDALGGYLIASAILTKHGRLGLESWVKEAATLTALNGSEIDCHPLALDIFRSLVGLLPRRLNRQQLWQLLDEPLRTSALRMTASLEGSYLDETTLNALAELLRQPQHGSNKLFPRLFRTRGACEHPLNAKFLDQVLRPMSVGARDAHWTEWVRHNYADRWERSIDVLQDLQQLESYWQKNVESRGPSDLLRATWVMWLLPTTARNLRDRATRALYWFGRGDSKGLFELMDRASEINDPYVFERVLAASYGVAMAEHDNWKKPEFSEKLLPFYAKRLYELLFKEDASARTTHILTREYGRRFIELALHHDPKLISPEEIARTWPPYANGGRINWQESDNAKEERSGKDSPFRINFENYTLGSLVEGRSNYDFRNKSYREVRAKILWRIEQFGWSPDVFQQIENLIENSRNTYGRTENDHLKIDRYGKKYSLIAYLELRGLLQDEGKINDVDYERTRFVDIDPSFPFTKIKNRLIEDDFLGSVEVPTKEWIKTGSVPNLKSYLKRAKIFGEKGPWVMLDGYCSQEDESKGRKIFCFVRSFLVKKSQSKKLAKHLKKQPLGGRWLPEKPRFMYSFSGEMPWCTTFPDYSSTQLSFDDEIEGTSEEFNVLMPTCDMEWVGNDVDNQSIGSEALGKKLAQDLALINLPQTHDFQTKKGVRATLGTAFSAPGFHNSEHFLFIRRDMLMHLLNKQKLALVWAVWGERELSTKQLLQAQFKRTDEPLYANFQAVYQF